MVPVDPLFFFHIKVLTLLLARLGGRGRGRGRGEG